MVRTEEKGGSRMGILRFLQRVSRALTRKQCQMVSVDKHSDFCGLCSAHCQVLLCLVS
jgi:hypothetical protein